MQSVIHCSDPDTVHRAKSSTDERFCCVGVQAETIPPIAKLWTGLSVGSLVLAGLLSLAVVLGRMPVLSGVIDDPLFFRRCLVVHVVLALVVWFYAGFAGLIGLRSSSRLRPDDGMAFIFSALGVGCMLAGALAMGSEPILANYVPVIDHPWFLAGVALFFAGVAFPFLRALTDDVPHVETFGILPEAAFIGLKACAVAVLLAMVTWVAAISGLNRGLDAWTYYEFSAWGPGHVLQVANVAAMLAIWLWALDKATGQAVLRTMTARILFTLLVLPHFAMPLLTMKGTMHSLYYSGATQLMRWGIFPVVTVVLYLCLRHLWMHRDARGTVSTGALKAAFYASAGLTVFGMLLGASIRGSTTLVPAHYHASLGGVTLALMAAIYLVVLHRGGEAHVQARSWTSARRQLWVYGVGQAVFALGFGIGGFYGLGRKTYASEQQVREFGEYIGLSVMGLGGLAATVGGVWFLVVVLRLMREWLKGDSRQAG